MIVYLNVYMGISFHFYGDLIFYLYGYIYTDELLDMDHIDYLIFVVMGVEMECIVGYYV